VSGQVPPAQEVPVGILAVNVVGAFLLGLLLERLLRAGPDTGGRRDLRLLLGTGFLGGFTTYSTLATDTVALLVAGAAGRALLYAFGTLLLGLLASLAGIWCGGRPGAGKAAR
jgi:CrcB protein